jgi:hypothetical protein
MVPDILSKLQLELAQDLTSERQVVYILVQIRKLIDSDNRAKDLEALRLHCDWVVHPRLDRKGAKELLGKLNDRYTTVLKTNPNADLQELSKRLGLRAFQAEFQEFLRRYCLDGSFCDADWWFAFLYHYSHVIQDCPLESAAEPDWYFDKIVLLDPDLTGSTGHLYMQWEFSLAGRGVGLWVVHHDRDSLAPTLTAP